MKHLLLTTIAAVLLVGCGESQSTAKAPDISIHDAVEKRNIEAVKKHLADGVAGAAEQQGSAQFQSRGTAVMVSHSSSKSPDRTSSFFNGSQNS